MSGGGAVVSFEIANTLVSLGHKVTVLVPDVEWRGKKYLPAMHPNLSVVRVETPSRTNLKIAARRCKGNLSKKGVEIGKKNAIDFIFTIFHPFHTVPNAAILCAKKLGMPVIVKIDDAVYEKSFGLKSLQRRMEKVYSSKALQNANNILVPNEATAKIVSTSYCVKMEKISIVPNGIDLGLFQIKDAKREKIVVFSGVMYYHRGLDILLDAIPEVIKDIPDAKFVLLGEGPEMKKLQDKVKEMKLDSYVEFKGWVERNLIPRYLIQASLGIGPLKLTTVTENALPIKVLEYMAASLPIIARKGTLPKDVLMDNENGYFIDNASDLAKKITKLLNDPNLVKKMGDSSFNMVQRFSWRNILNIIFEIYKTI